MIKNKFWVHGALQEPFASMMPNIKIDRDDYGQLLDSQQPVSLTPEDRAVVFCLRNIDIGASYEDMATDCEHELRRAYQTGLNQPANAEVK